MYCVLGRNLKYTGKLGEYLHTTLLKAISRRKQKMLHGWKIGTDTLQRRIYEWLRSSGKRSVIGEM